MGPGARPPDGSCLWDTGEVDSSSWCSDFSGSQSTQTTQCYSSIPMEQESGPRAGRERSPGGSLSVLVKLLCSLLQS